MTVNVILYTARVRPVYPWVVISKDSVDQAKDAGWEVKEWYGEPQEWHEDEMRQAEMDRRREVEVALRGLLDGMATEHDDSRISYVSMQVDRDVLDAARTLFP